MRKCKSPNLRSRKELAIREWPVKRIKRSGRKYLHFYRRARRNNAEMHRDGWRSRQEMDNA